MKLSLFSRSAISALAVLLAATPTWAQNDALLDILVRKGVLTKQEAGVVAAEAAEQEAKKQEENSASKIKLSSSISELKLYGDVRLRYQYDSKDFQVSPADGTLDEDRTPSGTQRSRFRFRLRLNADFKLGENWFGGTELQTALASDSGNQTFEDGFSDYPIFISRAFIGFKWDEWLTVTGGKAPNPFYTTDLVWDPDINPAGLFEQINLTELFTKRRELVANDPKEVVAKDVVATDSPWDFTLVAGQMIFDDNLEGGGADPGLTDNDSTTDAFMFETQLIASYKFSDRAKVTVAPGWMYYTAGTVAVSAEKLGTFGDINENSFKDNALVSGSTRNLNIVLMPGDFTFKIGKVKTKLFWDVAYNLEGKKRFKDVYDLATAINTVNDPDDFSDADYDVEDSLAWLVGVQLGENKKAGDVSFFVNYRQTGVAAVDPNLNDSDFALSELNTRGFKASLGYNLSDFAILNLTYMYAWNLKDNLVGGQATTGNAIADSNDIHVLQVDLNLKF